jgi:uncharacterized protein
MASSAEEQEETISIPTAFAKQGIYDALIGFPTGIKASMLRFFSPGEPTMRMDIIRECVDYARHINPDIKVELQTNGLFPSLEDTIWIANNIDIVWFSLDGPPEINDVNRPDKDGKGQTKAIEENLNIVSQFAKVGVRSTIVEKTIERQEDLVDYYLGLGITNLGFNPVIRPIQRKDEGNKEVTRVSIMNFAKNFLQAYNHAKSIGVVLASSLTFNFDEPTHIACRSLVPMPQLNPDTSVSSCDMALYCDTKKELQCFLYGAWDNDEKTIRYDSKKIHHLQNRNIDKLPKCKNCEIKRFCAGGCAGRVAYQTGSIYKVIPEYCLATKFLAERMPLGDKRFVITHP